MSDEGRNTWVGHREKLLRALSWLIFPKMLSLLFMESLILLLKIKPVLVLERLRFSICSHNANIYLLCGDGILERDTCVFRPAYRWWLQDFAVLPDSRADFAMFVSVQGITLQLQPIITLEMHWLLPLFPWSSHELLSNKVAVLSPHGKVNKGIDFTYQLPCLASCWFGIKFVVICCFIWFKPKSHFWKSNSANWKLVLCPDWLGIFWKFWLIMSFDRINIMQQYR